MSSIGKAITAAERLDAYRLRYRVFYREMGDDRYAIHAESLWMDCDDGPQSTLLIATDDDRRTIGTLRVTLRRQWPFIAHDKYPWEALARATSIDSSTIERDAARFDRGVIAPEYRRSGVFAGLERAAEEIAAAERCSLIVAAVMPDNHRSLRVCMALGWNLLEESGDYRGLRARILYKRPIVGVERAPHPAPQ